MQIFKGQLISLQSLKGTPNKKSFKKLYQHTCNCTWYSNVNRSPACQENNLIAYRRSDTFRRYNEHQRVAIQHILTHLN